MYVIICSSTYKSTKNQGFRSIALHTYGFMNYIINKDLFNITFIQCYVILVMVFHNHAIKVYYKILNKTKNLYLFKISVWVVEA